MKRIKLDIQRFASGTIGFTTDGAMTGKIDWSSTVQGSTPAEKASLNKSSVTAIVYVRRTYSWTQGDFTGNININGNVTNYTSPIVYVETNWVEVARKTIDVPHNTDGSKTITISGVINGPTGTSLEGRSVNGSASCVLDRIARYATSVQSLKSKTETSITMNWSSDSTIDYIWYSKDNGTNWTAVGGVNASSGSYTISNLSANTTYNIKTRVRRKDSQLTTDSSASAIATYNWPNCTSAPNFTIGNSVTLQFYNPLNRTFDIRLWSHTSQSFISDSITISGTSYTFTPDASTLYESIPNSKSSVYNVDSTYNTHKIVKIGGSYSVNESESKPEFEDFGYADMDATTFALTNDRSIIVQNYSDVVVTIPIVNRAFAKNSATMKQYNVVIGNKSTSIEFSDSSTVSGRIDNIPSNIINVYAEDSRGLTKLVTKTATLKAYTTIQKNEINVERAGNVGTGVTLTYNGTLWGESFGSVTNTAKSARYRFKKTNEDWPQTWNGTTTITPTTNGNNYSFTGGIAGDLGNTGFSAEYSFNIEVEVFDELSSTVFSFTLGTGIPHIAVADDGIAIKQPYDDNLGGALQVNGTASVSKNLKIPKDSTAGYGITNSDGASVLRNGANTNTIVDATGGGLYLGYQNTNNIDFLNGKAHLTQNGLDFRNNNSGSIEWKENGFGDKFRLIPDFGGADDSNKFKVQGTVGGSGADPTSWKDLMTVSGKSGNVNVAGALTVGGVATLLTSAFRFRKYKKSITVPANGFATLNMGALNVPSGYEYLGVIPYQNGYGDQWVVSYGMYSGANLYAMVHSRYGGSLTTDLECYVVYINTSIKSSMIL